MENQARNLRENLLPGEADPTVYNIGAQIQASDVDAVDTQSWRIGGPTCDATAYPACAGLTGNDDGMFGIEQSTGQLFLADPTSTRYTVGQELPVVVEVTDKGDFTATATVTVTITDENDPPSISGASGTILENSNVGTVVIASIPVSDEDTAQTHTFEITKGVPSSAVDMFAVDPNTGAISLAQAVLDFEGAGMAAMSPPRTFQVYIVVTDSHTSPLTAAAWFNLEVTNVNEAPVVANAAFSVDENSDAGTVVGSLVASDVDAGDSAALVYTMVPADPATGTVLALDPATGVITVNGALNKEDIDSYTYTVTVADPHTPALTDTASLTVSGTTTTTTTTRANTHTQFTHPPNHPSPPPPPPFFSGHHQ